MPHEHSADFWVAVMGAMVAFMTLLQTILLELLRKRGKEADLKSRSNRPPPFPAIPPPPLSMLSGPSRQEIRVIVEEVIREMRNSGLPPP